MEVLFLEPLYKEYIWGGQRIKNHFNRNITNDIAESWELAINKEGVSAIKNSNQTLKDLFDGENKREIFGTKIYSLDNFPLLIKIIDATQNLSVQVHPNDEYAKIYENCSGKEELWYIIDCVEDAQIICGFKEKMSKEKLEEIIKNNEINQYLNYLPIKKGDIIHILPGTIHAILKGILICEIQQNSNITYRVYDWNRLGFDGNPRPVHIKQSIDTIDSTIMPKVIDSKENIKLETNHFTVEKIQITEKYQDKSNLECFYALNIIEGCGKVKINEDEYKIEKGDCLLIPAFLGEYSIEGQLTLLKSYI